MFDVISWVKDGAWCLPRTLARLDDVLPSECVGRKIAVDDGSQDDSVKVLKDFGWDVYCNPGRGIGSAANFALSKVSRPFFMSFEQDLFLSKNWFVRMADLLSKPDCFVASGVRFVDFPGYLNTFERLVVSRNQNHACFGDYGFGSGKTLDNTLWTTKAVKSVGGFPVTSSSTGIDVILAYLLHSNGFKWFVDFDAASVHLRKKSFDWLSHYKWYYCGVKEEKRKIKEVTGIELNSNFLRVFKSLCFSPLRGLHLSFLCREPRLFLLYSYLRLCAMFGYIKGYE